MGFFKGMAPIGAYGTREGFALYCCNRFGFDGKLGYFCAGFTEYEAAPPMTEAEAEDRLRDRMEERADDAGAAARMELCERLDCAPSRLADALLDEALADYGGDPFAACAAELDARGFGEGDLVLFDVAGGQHDSFDALERYFIDPSAAAELRSLWGEYHLKREVPADAMARAEAVIAALEAAPTPEEAAGAYYAENPGCFSGR